MRDNGCRYGTHRVFEPKDALPQAAKKIDNSLPIYNNEMLIEVDMLNIDSASFHQMKDACHNDSEKIKEMILSIVSERGKQQNPVTGSGGMLLGTVAKMGPDFPNKQNLKVGDKIATLVSLSLTPLNIEEILDIYPDKDQVKIKGTAILFESGVVGKIPSDFDETLALAILDIAGAPAQARRLVKPNMNVAIIGGGGKSGSVCAAVARDILGKTGKLIAIEPSPNGIKRLKTLGYCDHILNVSATNPVDCLNAVSEVTSGEMCDLVINCAPVNSTEMSSIMSAKVDGTVYFFTMTTSFTAAALGAEGIGSDATLIIGNGYAPNNDQIALDVLRNHPELKKIFEEFYL